MGAVVHHIRIGVEVGTDRQKTGGEFTAKLSKLMRQIFPYHNENDQNDPTIVIETSNSGERWNVPGQGAPSNEPTALGANGETDRDRIFIKRLPDDRMGKYNHFAEMAEDSTIAAALNIHIGHAFSVDIKTGKAITLKPKTEADAEYVAKLQAEVIDPINAHIRNWIKPTCEFGVNYIRPHAELGKGIVTWESNYYTLPTNIREYERAGQLAGFSSENLTKKEQGEIRLAEPWALIPLKLPNWTPSIHKEPVQFSARAFSLYDDAYRRTPMETQNYGQSLLETSYESWYWLREALKSLIASRQLAGKKDRFVTVSTAGLDTARAAEYINLVTSQLKSDKEASLRQQEKSGLVSSVWNAIIPLMGDKGGVNIDTQTMSPDIQHIEDIMFHLKRLAGTLGVDPSMLGFSDLLAGGLGEGGFLRTSIQSAMTANLLRSAAFEFTQRSIDIHTAFRDGKVWLPEDRPYEICFNSMSTAIAQEEEAARETRANYATVVASVLDLIEQGAMAKSGKFKTHLYTNILELDPELTKEILAELAKKTSEDKAMMESLQVPQHLQNERYVRDIILDVFSELNTGDNDD